MICLHRFQVSRKVFAPLVEQGFLEYVNGEAEVGAALIQHPGQYGGTILQHKKRKLLFWNLPPFPYVVQSVCLPMISIHGFGPTRVARGTDVDEVIVTGGCATYDRIMWGAPQDQQENKRKRQPLLKKRLVCPPPLRYE